MSRRWEFPLSLATALAFLAAMRLLVARQVVRDGTVVLPGNDPYHFQYWVDQLHASNVGVLDLPAIGATVPDEYVLTYAIGWWFSLGYPGIPDFAIAALPVLASVALGGLVAWMAWAVTEDQRVAVLAVVLLAALPGHAQYALVGFFDHHALDHVWLASMAAALVWLARDREQRQTVLGHLASAWTWYVAYAFGLATTAAMMTWSGAPLLLLGVAVYATLQSVSAVRTDDSPLLVTLPLVVGLGVATVASVGLHAWAGWQTAAAALAPAVVLAGTVGVVTVATAVDRVRPDPRLALGACIAAGLAGLFAIRTLAPSLFARYRARFWGDLVGRERIVETRGLLDPDFLIAGGPVQQFGLLLFVALPALAYASWRCVERDEPRWLVLVSFGWATLALLCFQIRFSGQFAPFGVILGAVGVLGVLSWGDLGRPLGCFGDRDRRDLELREALADPERVVYVSLLLAVIVTVGVLLTVVPMAALTIAEEEHEAAAWIAEDTEGDEYVLGWMGRARMYNYVAWGGGDGYRYAHETTEDFLASSDPDRWFDEFANASPAGTDRIGYVVVPDLPHQRIDRETAYHQLFVAYGSATNLSDGVGHFRLVYLTSERSQAVFEPVPGARLEGRAPPGETVTVETPVTVGETTFVYRRRATADATGTYSLRVAYPGAYTLPDGSTVQVSEAAVREGAELVVDRAQ